MGPNQLKESIGGANSLQAIFVAVVVVLALVFIFIFVFVIALDFLLFFIVLVARVVPVVFVVLVAFAVFVIVFENYGDIDVDLYFVVVVVGGGTGSACGCCSVHYCFVAVVALLFCCPLAQARASRCCRSPIVNDHMLLADAGDILRLFSAISSVGHAVTAWKCRPQHLFYVIVCCCCCRPTILGITCGCYNSIPSYRCYFCYCCSRAGHFCCC